MGARVVELVVVGVPHRLPRARAGLAPSAAQRADLGMVLEFFLLEKCVYEIGYELNNRPDWLEIPMRGLLELLPVQP
jgi:maltose alpha-D-glucosyltransferase / alpha-amylase